MNIREGDIVYHKTNDKVKMIVVSMYTPARSPNEYAACRWIDSNENIKTFDFKPLELIKKDEKDII